MRNQITLVLVLLVFGLIGYDIYVMWESGLSISRVIVDSIHERPEIAYAAGIVSGHLFWAMDRPTNESRTKD